MGYGLFAARDFKKDEFIFHEGPVLKALFNEASAQDQTLMQGQLMAYRNALESSRDELVTVYPLLAASHGIAPPTFDDAEPILDGSSLGKFLVHGQFAGSTVTREEYEAFTAKIQVASSPSENDCRIASLNFFKHYAFDARKNSSGGIFPVGSRAPNAVPGQNYDACLYLLGSLVNHCCTPRMRRRRQERDRESGNTGEPEEPQGPNCSWRIGRQGLAKFVLKKNICVEAIRDIKEGEQLTWDYGKQDVGFVCECSTCRFRPTSPCGVM